MKITEHLAKTVDFVMIQWGEVFYCEDNYWIKLKIEGKAVNLRDGELSDFSDDTQVQKWSYGFMAKYTKYTKFACIACIPMTVGLTVGLTMAYSDNLIAALVLMSISLTMILIASFLSDGRGHDGR